MNYKKNLILLLSLVNISIVIFLLVNNNKREKFQECPAVVTTSSEGEPVCNVLGLVPTISVTEEGREPINHGDYILYFILDSPTSCEITTLVNQKYETHFKSPEKTFIDFGVSVIGGDISEFKNFIGCNSFKQPCSAFCTRSPWILISYPFTREFKALNNLTAKMYDNPTFSRTIHSVTTREKAEEFVEIAKQSQDPNSFAVDPNSDFSNPDLCQGITAGDPLNDTCVPIL